MKTALIDLLNQNWAQWKNGGVSELFVSQALSKETEGHFRQFLEDSSHQLKEEIEDLTSKQLLDLATWCYLGTHTLPFLPPNLRAEKMEEAAVELAMPKKLMPTLIDKITAYFNQ